MGQAGGRGRQGRLGAEGDRVGWGQRDETGQAVRFHTRVIIMCLHTQVVQVKMTQSEDNLHECLHMKIPINTV